MNKFCTVIVRLFMLLTFAASAFSCNIPSRDVVSPDGKLKVTIRTQDADAFGDIGYDIEYNGQNVMSGAKLGVKTEFRDFFGNLKLRSVSDVQKIVDDYQMLTGKRSHCHNEANEKVFIFETEKKDVIGIVFRAYNNGVAFRYSIAPSVDGERITEELTTYPIAEGTNRWMQPYKVDYEDFYPLTTASTTGAEWGYPALIEVADSVFTLITEANVMRGTCASRLVAGGSPDEYRVKLADDKMKADGASQYPWRVIMVGSLADIVESTLVTDVSEPCKVLNTGWIVPGPSAWIYWAYNHSSNDFPKVREYIDLAAEMGWPYNLIDWKWDEMGNGGNIEDAVAYSLEKGVKPMLWYNSCTIWSGPGSPGPHYRLNEKENRVKEYAWLRDLGVAGIKVDFFAGDATEVMDYYIGLLEDAADYELMINFHGATIPRGWQRTYPHMMTVEGVYGAEWYNNLPVLTSQAARHNATLPFTRNVVGPMDYTPGTFSDSQHPHITSYGHELALCVVFESALQHMPDRPSSYLSLPEPVKKFLSGLPTAWDETKLLAGYPGVDVVIARRKADVWYVGGLNGTDENRAMRFNLSRIDGAG